MRAFSNLFTQLDQTTKTTLKVSALKRYFDQADDMDKIWTIAILSHRRPKRTVRTNLLREWAAEAAGIPLWLFEESYHVVGDLAETMATVHPNAELKATKSLSEWIAYIKALDGLEEADKKEQVLSAWNQLDRTGRFVFNKLITGGWRMGVSQKLMTKALSQHSGIEENVLSHRLMGNWTPDTVTYEKLILEENPSDHLSRPYPFYLAYGLEQAPEELGAPDDWLAERKWDGIRGQLIVRNDEIYLWSRGEELVTDKFPEFEPLKEILPNGTVLDGEILPYQNGQPLGFQVLQTRIGRKNVTKNILQKAPVILMVYDLLEWEGDDWRERSMMKRRQQLEQLVESLGEKLNGIVKISEVLAFEEWETLVQERARSRAFHSEGLMLKRKAAPYQVGRKKGDWWKWKVDPLTVDAVLIYAMRGHGRRANLYTDYTFAVWKGEELVPFTKAYSGLTDAEIRQVDAYVKKNTIERFGPVRSVTPMHVFEIAFEGIAASTRHKSGLALRFPRMLRWRKDKPIDEANTLEDLQKMLQIYGQ